MCAMCDNFSVHLTVYSKYRQCDLYIWLGFGFELVAKTCAFEEYSMCSHRVNMYNVYIQRIYLDLNVIEWPVICGYVLWDMIVVYIVILAIWSAVVMRNFAFAILTFNACSCADLHIWNILVLFEYGFMGEAVFINRL